MTTHRWAQRVPSPTRPRELYEVRDAAQDLAEQAKHAPGRTGPAFRSVSEVLLLGTALVTSALALVHLYRALNRPQHPHKHEDQRGKGHADAVRSSHRETAHHGKAARQPR